MTSPIAIPPLVGLTFSLLGGIFLTCSKYLVFDFPRGYRALKFQRRHAASVATIHLDRDRDILAILRNAENAHHDRVVFFQTIMDGKLKFTEETKKEASRYLFSLSEQQGRLRSLGNIGTVSYENCQRALLGTTDAHRERLLRIRDCTAASDVGGESKVQELDLIASCAEINEAIKVLTAQYDFALLAREKELNDIKAEFIGLWIKFWAASAVTLALVIVATGWLLNAT